MSLLQHLFLMASACTGVSHVPDANVAHQPQADVAFSQSFSADDLAFKIPVEVDVLRGKQVAKRPMLGETAVATAIVKGRDVTLLVPGQSPLSLSAPCTPVAEANRR